MAEQRGHRRLAAILAADVAGYSRLMEQDESATLAALNEWRGSVLEPLVAAHQGRVVKVMGDGVLVEFASAVNAVGCAAEMQQRMATANAGLAADRHIVLRIGVNLGDVVVEDGDLYGDGVIIAVRLQTMAEPGEIWIAGNVHDQVEKKLPLAYDDLGRREIKNMERPVHVFRIAGNDTRQPAAGGGVSVRPSIAVLPFTNMSGNAEQQFFSDGITEDIITELSRFRQLQVLARNSSFRYRGQDVDVVRVGRELGIRYLVEGSVRRIGGRIRITAQLIDAATGHHLWAERFDRDQEDLFAVQDQVVRTLVSTLVGRLEAAALEHVKRKPPASLAAYECVLRGDALPFGNPETEAEKRRLFEKAVDLDPGYARAHALLAASYVTEWLHDMTESNDALDHAFELARKAISIDENDSVCQSLLAWVHLNRGSVDLAEHHYRRAIDLNRNRPMTLAALGGLYANLGKPEEAIGYLNEAKLIDPFFDPSWYEPQFGIVHFIAGRYDDAIAAFDRSKNRSYWVEAYLAACHALSGRIDRAGEHAAAVLRQMPNFSLVRFAAKEQLQRPADAQNLLDGLRKAGLPE